MSELKLEEARRTRLDSEKAAFTLELESRLETERKEIESKQIEYRAVRDRLQLARRDLDRVRVLYQKTLTSERELAIEQDKVLSLQGENDRASTAVENIAQRELDSSRSDPQAARCVRRSDQDFMADDRAHPNRFAK